VSGVANLSLVNSVLRGIGERARSREPHRTLESEATPITPRGPSFMVNRAATPEHARE